MPGVKFIDRRSEHRGATRRDCSHPCVIACPANVRYRVQRPGAARSAATRGRQRALCRYRSAKSAPKSPTATANVNTPATPRSCFASGFRTKRSALDKNNNIVITPMLPLCFVSWPNMYAIATKKTMFTPRKTSSLWRRAPNQLERSRRPRRCRQSRSIPQRYGWPTGQPEALWSIAPPVRRTPISLRTYRLLPQTRPSMCPRRCERYCTCSRPRVIDRSVPLQDNAIGLRTSSLCDQVAARALP